MFRLLPSLGYLKKTQPHLYDNTICPICRNSNEDWLHLFLCPDQESRIIECVELTINQVSSTMKDYIIDFNDFIKDISALSIWSLPSSRNFVSRNFDLIDFLQGFIPHRLENFLSSNLYPTPKKKHM